MEDETSSYDYVISIQTNSLSLVCCIASIRYIQCPTVPVRMSGVCLLPVTTTTVFAATPFLFIAPPSTSSAVQSQQSLLSASAI